jgi:hypothetical protein
MMARQKSTPFRLSKKGPTIHPAAAAAAAAAVVKTDEVDGAFGM